MDKTSREHPRPLILVVDDDRTVRMSLKRFLEMEEYRVLEAENGQEAVERFCDTKPDLILMDVFMPIMDGCEACRLIKENPRGQRTPVLMVTAHHDEESIERAYASGAIDYVTKPLHWVALKKRISTTLEFQLNQNQLVDLNQQYQLLLNSVVEGICRVDDQCHIMYANPAVEHMLGLDMDEIIGKHITTILKDCEEDKPTFEKEISRGVRLRLREAQLRRGDGTSLVVAVTSAPLIEKGVRQGSVVIILDITER